MLVFVFGTVDGRKGYSSGNLEGEKREKKGGEIEHVRKGDHRCHYE
jgi:hypothetical protein